MHLPRFSKTNRLDTAAQRTPPEIWWTIFDQLIYIPMMFSTIYQGNNWTKDAHYGMLLRGWEVYRDSEKQRRILGSVCRSWRLWAQSRRHRRVVLDSRSDCWDSSVQNAQSARRVEIWAMKYRPAKLFPQGVEWDIVSLHQLLAIHLASIPHPRLRRLRILDRNKRPYDPNPFLETLSQFSELTWLEYDDGDSSLPHGLDIPVSNDRKPVLLPNLQAFFYRSPTFFKFPLSHVILPSLQYLAIHCEIPADLFPIVDVLLHYRKTIRSVTIGAYRVMHLTHTVQFPQWSEFPKLEELAVTENWVFHFDPLSPDHPLRKIIAHHASLDAVSSMLDSPNMRQIVLLRSSWTKAGTLVFGNENNTVDVDDLVEKANKYGIKFEAAEEVVTDHGEEVYLSSEAFLSQKKPPKAPFYKILSRKRSKSGIMDHIARSFLSKK
jgi:hypothetical protein